MSNCKINQRQKHNMLHFNQPTNSKLLKLKTRCYDCYDTVLPSFVVCNIICRNKNRSQSRKFDYKEKC